MASRAVGDAAHFIVVRGPGIASVLFEFRGVREDLRPGLCTVFKKKRGVEGDAASDLDASCGAVLVADLSELMSCRYHVVEVGDT